MNRAEKVPEQDSLRDIKDRPSRARYDKVKHGLDLKWRRRTPKPERMMREVIDGLWDAFGESPWTWCGLWLSGPGGSFEPGPARPDSSCAVVPADILTHDCFRTGKPRLASGSIAVGVCDKNSRPWFVFQAKALSPFDDMDARWLERMFKAFQTIERPEFPLP